MTSALFLLKEYRSEEHLQGCRRPILDLSTHKINLTGNKRLFYAAI